jgi:hypothetical protein
MTQHSVVVQFYDFAEKFWTDEAQTLDALLALEDELSEALEGTEIGEVDGHEVAIDGSDGFLFLYGPDADALFAAIEPILRKSPVMAGADATLRYGDPDQEDLKQQLIKIDQTTH